MFIMIILLIYTSSCGALSADKEHSKLTKRENAYEQIDGESLDEQLELVGKSSTSKRDTQHLLMSEQAVNQDSNHQQSFDGSQVRNYSQAQSDNNNKDDKSDHQSSLLVSSNPVEFDIYSQHAVSGVSEISRLTVVDHHDSTISTSRSRTDSISSSSGISPVGIFATEEDYKRLTAQGHTDMLDPRGSISFQGGRHMDEGGLNPNQEEK